MAEGPISMTCCAAGMTEDAARPDAVGRRHAANGRTARENIADLVDPGSFVEYGRFVMAAQRQRRDVDDLIARTPRRRSGRRHRADQRRPLRSGPRRRRGAVLRLHRARRHPGRLRAPEEGPAVRAHRTDAAADRVLRRGRRRAARRHRLPTVSSLEVRAFKLWAALSGVVPRIAVVKGRCFAGNAVIAGCSDLIVATEDTSIGMGGPAMIAGGGLGDVDPDAVGPISVQAPNGVVDVVGARRGRRRRRHQTTDRILPGFDRPGPAADQTALRTMIPGGRAAPIRWRR